MRGPAATPPRLLPPQAVLDVGRGFSGNTINTVVFRSQGLVTAGDRQFGAYYADAQSIVLFARDLGSGELKTARLEGRYNISDAHDSISLGIDRAGHLHLAYDHHGSALHYRRSLRPFDIGGFGPEVPMLGRDEGQVSYVSFIAAPLGDRPLLCLYRTGYAGRGDAVLNAFDEQGQGWSRVAGPLLSGSQHKPWTSSPYWNHPATDAEGNLWLSFCWRTHPLEGERQLVNNIGIGIARSPDWGTSWQTSRGVGLGLPLTQVNAETMVGVAPGSNLINQTGCAVDGAGRVHVVYYADDEHGIPQYHHAWGRAGVWRTQAISARTADFALEGKGTLQLPMSRPDVVIDELDRVYVVFRADITAQRMAVLRLDPPDYRFLGSQLRLLWDTDLGHTEPVIDRGRWQREKVLSMLLQHAEQPDHEGSVADASARLFVADWALGNDWDG
jgi:BNR repeat-containing family member